MRIDQVTSAKDLGMYALILVEVDFNRDIWYELTVKRLEFVLRLRLRTKICQSIIPFAVWLVTRFSSVGRPVSRRRVLFPQIRGVWINSVLVHLIVIRVGLIPVVGRAKVR